MAKEPLLQFSLDSYDVFLSVQAAVEKKKPHFDPEAALVMLAMVETLRTTGGCPVDLSLATHPAFRTILEIFEDLKRRKAVPEGSELGARWVTRSKAPAPPKTATRRNGIAVLIYVPQYSPAFVLQDEAREILADDPDVEFVATVIYLNTIYNDPDPQNGRRARASPPLLF